MVAGICHNYFKILLAGTFKFTNRIPIFQYSDDAVIAMTSFRFRKLNLIFEIVSS